MTRQESKKIVKEIHEKYYGKKGAKNKKAKIDAQNGRIAERVASVSGEKSRNDLMLEAKAKGIKNFRILSKNELMHVIAEGITQQEIDALVAGAVARWKSGWGKGKDKIKAKS